MNVLNNGQLRALSVVLLGGLCMNAAASEVGSLNTFSANTPARASEVNSNFSAVRTAVDDNASLITDLRASLNAALARLESLENSPVSGLNGFVSVDGNTVIFEGVNLQVTNGSGQTNSVNGAGNLIVGYNESRGDGTDDKDGSHNLVIGSRHNYPNFGGLVAGDRNTVFGAFASVTGGSSNTAEGNGSSVSGGQMNFASGLSSSVTAGFRNEAFGPRSSVNGGIDNIANGDRATVSGGEANVADGVSSHISGGSLGSAEGAVATVSGGLRNTAAGNFSTVGGGADRTAAGATNWTAGTLLEAN